MIHDQNDGFFCIKGFNKIIDDYCKKMIYKELFKMKFLISEKNQ